MRDLPCKLKSALSSFCGAVDWHAYHGKVCKTVDFCGAIQGTGAGEDIQHLLNVVVASIDLATDEASNADFDPSQTAEGADVALVRYSLDILYYDDEVSPDCEPISTIPIAI